jgi:hypothetical protein
MSTGIFPSIILVKVPALPRKDFTSSDVYMLAASSAKTSGGVPTENESGKIKNQNDVIHKTDYLGPALHENPSFGTGNSKF